MIKILGAVIGVALVGVGLLFDSPEVTNPSSTGYEIGEAAENFSLKNIDEKTVSLADYKNENGVIVIFTCNSCPYSKMYEDRIIALNEKYSSKGFPVVAIMPNDVTIKPEDSFSEMQKRAKEKKYGFPYLIDETQETTRIFGATKTPHVFLLQKNLDQFNVSFIGAIDDSPRNEESVNVKYVENAIDELLAGNEVSKTTAIAIGCSIKWSK